MPRGRLGGQIGGFFFSVVSTRGNGLVYYHIYLVGLYGGNSSIGGVHQTVSLLALPLCTSLIFDFIVISEPTRT